MDSLTVHLLPGLTAAADLAGKVVVVVDVLRATTTIIHALAAGALEVIPCLEVEDARRTASRFAPGRVVLGGERGGLPIEGFDLGNSPEEYSPRVVADKTVVLTTTNGTRALEICRTARRVLVAGFVNVSAVAEAIRDESAVDILCAGTRGRISRDDVLAAGCLAQRWLRQRGRGTQQPSPATAIAMNDSARMALDAWELLASAQSPGPSQRQPVDPAALAAQLRQTQGGRDLSEIGLAGDIDVAARIDRFSIVGQLDSQRGSIVAADRGVVS